MTPDKKRDWLTIILSGGVLAILLSIGGFAYNTWWNVPSLTYETLQSYPLSDSEQIVPVIIRNVGRVKASNVRITIDTTGVILGTQYKSPEQTTISGNGTQRFVSELTRLVQNTQVTFNFRIMTDNSEPISGITITSDEVSGFPHEVESEFSGTTIVLISAMTVLIIVFDLFLRFLQRELKKL